MMTKLTVLKHETVQSITENIYTLQDSNGATITYIEWTNDGGEIVDSVVRDKDGYEIDNPALVEKIWNALFLYLRK